MSGKTEADSLVQSYSEAAEAQENYKRNLERSAEQAQREKEEAIANVYEMAGKVKATNFFRGQAEFFNLVMLKKVKDSKEYRERFGMTWEKFCEYAGVNRRTVDRQLEELELFRQEFLDTLSNFSGVTFSKIKYLGMAISGHMSEISENAITYNGETIPLDADHKDEIQALLETLEESHKKQIEEKDATLAAKDRLLKSKEELVNKMERELKRLEKTVPKSELTEEEQDAVNLLAQIQSDFIAGLSDIKKKIDPKTAPEIALRQYYYLLIFLSKQTLEERLALQAYYEGAEEVPWEITEFELPSEDVLIDNMPMTAGRGMGAKVKAKLEERQAKKG